LFCQTRNCYSHLTELGAKAAESGASEEIKKEYTDKMDEMEKRYKEETKEIILADGFAKAGSKEMENKTIINLPETTVGVTTEEGQVVQQASEN